MIGCGKMEIIPMDKDEVDRIKEALQEDSNNIHLGGLRPCECGGTGWIPVYGPGGSMPCPHCSPKMI